MSAVNIWRLLTLLISTTSCLSLPNYGNYGTRPHNYGDSGTQLRNYGDHDTGLPGPVAQEYQPGHVDGNVTIDNSQCTLNQQVCARKTHCLDDLLNTEDAEILDLMDRSGKRKCTDPGHPDKAAVCCSHPGAPQPVVSSHSTDSKPRPVVPDVHKTNTYNVCPEHMVCVSDELCDQHGNVRTDGAGLVDLRLNNEKCVIDNISKKNGVCCRPPGQDVKEQMSTVKPNNIHRTLNQCGIRHQIKPEFPVQELLNNTAHNEADFGEFPWQAIVFFSNFTFKCGATLIGDRWLLTAAHCVYGIRAQDLNVRLGEWKINTFDEPLEYVDSNVTSITTHPKFNRRNLHNDISILELKEPVPPQYHINSLCLPKYRQTFWGQRCIITGWGKDAFNGQYQIIMKKVELPLVDHNTCQYHLRRTRLGKYFTLDKTFLCAGGEGNEDACKGDGGGPLACQNPDSGRFELTGITSWGIGCGIRNIPGVYVNVPEFIPWMEAIISDSHESTIQEH